MMPFSKEELAYIERLDPAADCELLRRELPALRPECGRTLQVATALLQAAAAAGLRCAAICPRRQLLCSTAHPLARAAVGCVCAAEVAFAGLLSVHSDGVAHALCSLAEIGEVMSRPLVGMDEEASQLERLCLACRAAVLDADGDATSRYPRDTLHRRACGLKCSCLNQASD
jgi:hypothetical protein